MKKTIIRTIIACMAAAMIMTAAGCGGSSDGNNSGTQSVSPFGFPGGTANTSTFSPTPTASVPVTDPTPVPTPTGSVNAAYVGTYYARVDANAIAGLTADEQAQMTAFVNSTYITLNSDGSLTGAYGGQAISGSWADAGSSQVSLVINGSTITYTIQNGIIYDPADTSSYFQKG